MSDIKQVSLLWKNVRMGLQVLGPDVNESFYKFTVNDNYAVRFGMGAKKEWVLGQSQRLLKTQKDGKYKSILSEANRFMRCQQKRLKIWLCRRI
jgi:DNA polymerase-3 subunit alpha